MNGAEPVDPVQAAEAARWFAKAEEDLQVVRLVLAMDPSLLDPAAYHCQQAAEKVLKGLIVSRGLDIPRSHDLALLASLVAPLWPVLAARCASLSPLTQWATVTRYPDSAAGRPVTAEAVRSALSDIEALAGLAAAAVIPPAP